MADVRLFFKNHIFNIAIALLLCGRFYLIFGFTGTLKPIVGQSTIFFKDLLFIALFAYVIIVYWRDFADFVIRFKNVIFGILTIFFVILLLHSLSKPIETLAHHYVRNIFMYTLMIPIVAILIKNKRLNVEIIINSFLLLNLIFSIVQRFWLPNSMLDETRPLGVVGDPIVASLFNYFLIFKLLLEKIDWYKIGIVTLAFISIDAQASFTALLCIVMALVAAVFLDRSYYRSNFFKFLLAASLFLGVIFFRITPNDLSDRVLTVAYGTIGKYVGLQDSQRSETFQKLSEERVQVYKGHDFAPLTDFEDQEGYTAAGEVNYKGYFSTLEYSLRKNFLVGRYSIMTFSFGDYYRDKYYIVDSNLFSVFENLGLVSLILYYGCIAYILLLAIKLKDNGSKQIIFFGLSVLFLGFFCATIYKYPVMQLLYIYFGMLIYQLAPESPPIGQGSLHSKVEDSN